MRDFKVTITTTNNEVIKYMVAAKDEMFARCTATLRFDKSYKGESIGSIMVAPR